MDVFKTQNVPSLALALGNEVTLSALHSSFAAFPNGATYAQFRHILAPFLHKDANAGAAGLASPTSPAPTVHSPAFHHYAFHPKAEKRGSTASRATSAYPQDSLAAASVFSIATSSSPSSRRSGDFSTHEEGSERTRHHRKAHVLEDDRREDGNAEGEEGEEERGHDTNREETRQQRLSMRYELAGLSAAPVEPMKQLFNRIDVHNQQRVTWDSVLNYVVAEANAGVADLRYNANRAKIYSFSRALRCPTKQHRPTVAPPAAHGTPTTITSTSTRTNTAATTLTYKRCPLDMKDGKPLHATGKSGDGSGSVRVEEDLSLLRMMDGLASHNAVFFLSTRTHPFLLYSKESLERVFTATPDMLGEAAPTSVSYLAESDLFLCYSTDDRLLRGWFSLLAQSIATVAVTPLLVEGFVRRMQTMPVGSPTYPSYAESVFLGDSYGHVLHVVAPRGRAGGMEFAVQRTYRGLHSRASGGLVDFCVYGGHLFSSGFDGRVVATSLESGVASEIGSVDNEHLHALVFVPTHECLVAATSSTRQLLWWETGAQSALPGAQFENAGYGDHSAAIVSVVYVDDSDYLVSADCDGVVKVWEMATHRCVQSFQSSRMTSTGEGESGSGGSDVHTPEATLKSLGRAKMTSSSSSSGSGSGGAAAALAAGFAASAGRDMMMLTHNGLHSLLSEAATSSNHVGGAQCHSVSYCAETEEVMCGFVNGITCWGLRGHKNPFMCDTEEVCQDVLYDVRHQTFLLQSATRLGVWDGVHGVRKALLDRVTAKSTSLAGVVDIKSVCLDDLGSRLFVAAGDGNVYVVGTHVLATDVASAIDEARVLWYSGTALPSAPDGKAAPVVIEQMHFSSSLRTWLAITSGGTLLVRVEGDDRHVAFSTILNVSAHPLLQLRVSEELGLVAVLDAQSTVYVYDMEAWTDLPEVRALAAYGRVVDLTFLDAAPVLVTVHAGGVCRCWSCPPALECFELLGLVTHPQLPPPPPASQHNALDGIVLDLSAQAGRFGASATTAAAVGASGAGNNASVRAASATVTRHASSARDSASSQTRPLTASLRNRPMTANRDGTLRAGGNDSLRARATLNATRGHHILAQTARVQASNGGDFLKEAFGGRGGAASASAKRDSECMSPETLLTNLVERAKALASEAHEFTSVSYDGCSHHLFLGDAQGVVHVYGMCGMLQRYKLPRCTYASRAAFSLLSAERARPLSSVGGGGGGGGGVDFEGDWTVGGDPMLLRSVDVHVRHRDRTVARKRSLSVAAAARLPQTPQQSKSKPRKHAAGGVVRVRWLPSRGVLATSGNDREVWFLNTEGDRLAFLSAERLPPRPKTTAAAAAATAASAGATVTCTSLLGKVSSPESLAVSLMSGRSAAVDDGVPLQRPFFLPAVQPFAEDAHDTSAARGTDVASPCCTHPKSAREWPGRQLAKPIPSQNRASVSVMAGGGMPGNRNLGDATLRAQDSWRVARAASAAFVDDAPRGGIAPAPPPPTGKGAPAARPLADYLTFTNMKLVAAHVGAEPSSLTQRTSAPQLSMSLSTSRAPQDGSRGEPPLRPSRAPLRSPRFTKSGHAVQGVCHPHALPHAPTSGSRTNSPVQGLSHVAGHHEHAHQQILLEKSENAAGESDSASSISRVDSFSGFSFHTAASTVPKPATPTTSDRQFCAAVPASEALLQSPVAAAAPFTFPSADRDGEHPLAESLCVSGRNLASAPAAAAAGALRYSSLIKPEGLPPNGYRRAAPRHGHPALLMQLRPMTAGGFPGSRAGGGDRGGGGGGAAAAVWDSPSLQRAATASSARQTKATTYAGPPRMLVYSSANDGDATLDLYSKELQQRLRRPQ